MVMILRSRRKGIVSGAKSRRGHRKVESELGKGMEGKGCQCDCSKLVNELRNEVNELKNSVKKREDVMYDMFGDRLIWEWEMDCKIERMKKDVEEFGKISTNISVQRAVWEESVEVKSERILDEVVKLKNERFLEKREKIKMQENECALRMKERRKLFEEVQGMLDRMEVVLMDRVEKTETIKTMERNGNEMDLSDQMPMKNSDAVGPSAPLQKHVSKDLLIGNVNGYIAGEFCKKQGNRALAFPGIRVNELTFTVGNWRDNMAIPDRVVVKIGNYVPIDSGRRKYFLNDIKRLLWIVKEKFGGAKVSLCQLKTEEKCTINEDLAEMCKEIDVDMDDLENVIKAVTDEITSHGLERKENEERSESQQARICEDVGENEEMREGHNSRLGGLHTDEGNEVRRNKFFRTRLVWNKTM